jgi:DNA polymerase bacteriophage-type
VTQTVAFLDVEARSELNINDQKKSLPVRSVYDYARHESTEVLCLAWAIDDEPVDGFKIRKCNDVAGGLLPPSSGLDPWLFAYPGFLRFLNALDFGCLLVAHNAGFERNMWDGNLVPRLGFPAVSEDQWRCTMALCGHYGIPHGLGRAAEFLGIPGKFESNQKLWSPTPQWLAGKSGAPKWLGTPEEFDQNFEYCKQDVEVCRNLWRHLPKQTEFELQVWRVDQAINQTGIHVDLDLAKACESISERLEREANEELHAITNGALRTINQTREIPKWLASRGLVIPNLNKETVDRELNRGVKDPAARRVLQIRKEAASAAIKKYAAIASRATPSDHRIRGCFRYYGGHLGRWSAKGVQPQNPIRPPKGVEFEDILGFIPEAKSGGLVSHELFGLNEKEALQAMVRPTFCAAPGKTLVALDYSGEEPRVCAWLAGEKGLLDLFVNTRDPYTEMAIKIDSKHPNRALGKEVILGYQFGLQADSLYDRCIQRGIKTTREIVQDSYVVYHRDFPGIQRFWSSVMNAVRKALRNPGLVFDIGKIKIGKDPKNDVLVMMLPSGRRIFYHQVRFSSKGGVEYLNVDKGVYTYLSGSKLCENATQGTAACVQRYAIWALSRYLPQAPVVLHSHDEIVTEVDESLGQNTYEQQRAIMLSLPPYFDGLPLDAKGWIGKDYRKD